jgi:D-glutamate cyclase
VVPCMEACFATAGLVPAALADLRSGRHRCAFVGFPVDADSAAGVANELLDQLQPKAVIAIERPGAGSDGHYHGGGGFEISSFTAKTDVLFAAARARKIATIGIGDLGNELGLGVVAEAVKAEVPMGDIIAAAQPADIAVIANISNWGAYGVAACLAALIGNEAVFHDGAEEIRLIEACVRAGAIDPVGGQLRPYVDGTDARANAAMVDLLRSLVVLSQREGANISNYQDSWQKRG